MATPQKEHCRVGSSTPLKMNASASPVVPDLDSIKIPSGENGTGSSRGGDGRSPLQREMKIRAATASGARIGSSLRPIRGPLAALLAAMFCASLDATIVATALPHISGSFAGGSPAMVTWVMTSFLAGATATGPLYARLGYAFGRRWVFFCSQVIFVVGVGLCGVAQEAWLFVLGRVVEGIGAGGIISLNNIIIADLVPSPSLRGKVAALLGADYALSSLVGPLVGGAIASHSSWRVIFLGIMAPIGLLSLVLTFVYRNSFVGASSPAVSSDESAGASANRLPQEDWNGAAGSRGSVAGSSRMGLWSRIDVIGSLLVMLSVSCIIVAMAIASLPPSSADSPPSDGQWGEGRVIALLVISGVAAAAFLLNEWKIAKNPIVPLHVFRIRTVSVACVVSFSLGAALYCAVTFFPLYFVFVDNITDTTKAGPLLLPVVVSFIVSSIVVGVAIYRTSKYSKYPLIGSICSTSASVMFIFLRRTTPYWYIALGLIAVGIGLGMNISSLVIASQNACDVDSLQSLLGLPPVYLPTAYGPPLHSSGSSSGSSSGNSISNSSTCGEMDMASVAVVVITFFRNLAGALGIAIFQAIVEAQSGSAARLLGSLHSAEDGNATMQERDDLAYGIAQGWYFVLACCLLALIASLFMPAIPLQDRPHDRSKDGATIASASGTTAAIEEEAVSI